MKRGWNRRGQFYLIAAIVLAVVILGIAAVSNYSRKDSNVRINDLNEELQIESVKVLDYGTNNNLGATTLHNVLQDFTDHYISYEGRGDNSMYFVFGNTNNLTVKGYQETAKTVRLSAGSNVTITESAGEFSGGIDPSTSEAILTIDDNSYKFKINEGENFYFVISQESEGGEYVVTG